MTRAGKLLQTAIAASAADTERLSALHALDRLEARESGSKERAVKECLEASCPDSDAADSLVVDGLIQILRGLKR